MLYGDKLSDFYIGSDVVPRGKEPEVYLKSHKN